MKLKTTLLTAAATLAIAPAAHAYEGLYGAIGAGLSYFGYENDVSNDHPDGFGPVTFDSDSDYDNGIGIYVALGAKHSNGFRTELEYSYRTADIDQIDPQPGFSGIPSGSINGDTKIHALMANALYDFDAGGAVTPYLGGGVGVARVNQSIAGTNTVSGLSIAYGNRDYNFAYQGIAGVAVGLAENLALDVSYRYFGMLGNSYGGALINGAPAEIKSAAASHNLFAGLRWNFGGADKPVPVQYKDCWDGSSVPVSAECPPQIVEQQDASLDPIQFTVYFDYDKSNLTPQASTLIQEASSRALQNSVDTVIVSGNTDTSGSSAYNQALSERRARVVREALIANGVSADAIRTEAFGETNLAKPTADGVREPLNRRSEVVISFQ
jgi:outer membrane protein OmpA-like peptidoglycan-associated protein